MEQNNKISLMIICGLLMLIIFLRVDNNHIPVNESEIIKNLDIQQTDVVDRRFMKDLVNEKIILAEMTQKNK